MKILIEGIIILGSLAISIIAGYFLYTFIEGIRLDLYCKEFREGLDCYQVGWVTFPVWLFSLVGGFVAILSVALASTFTSSARARNSKITCLIGSILAFPLTFLMVGSIAFLITVLSGLGTLLVVLRLTNQGGRTASLLEALCIKEPMNVRKFQGGDREKLIELLLQFRGQFT